MRRKGPSKRGPERSRGAPGRKRDDRHGASRGPRHEGHGAKARGKHPAHGSHEMRGSRAAQPPFDKADRDAAAERVKDADKRLAERAPLRPGEWLWTTREGAERDLLEELLLAGDLDPRGLAPALVVSRKMKGGAHERLDLTFARQGFQVAAVVAEDGLARMAERLTTALGPRLGEAGEYCLQVFVPDSTQANPLAGRAAELESALAERLATALPNARRVDDSELRREPLPLVQVCLYAPGLAAGGVLSSDRALSLWPGGRARMRLHGELPSRAARKLEEAFAWLGMSPGPGETCVDLGAAPGGWSWLLLSRRARVIAVDPARMDEKLRSDKRLTHVQGDAFKFAPDAPVDWLFCDMAWRPLEVAQMLGRWARRRDTRMLVANFKLPMKRKAEMVRELRKILEGAGFTGLRTRQLYHDREEITVTARTR